MATPAMAKGYKASTGRANQVGNVLLVPVRTPTANVHATITVTCKKKHIYELEKWEKGVKHMS